MKFVDEAQIYLRSGDGGPGMVHFRRLAYRPKMGPDGGNGGRGGHVFLKATENMQSLLDFKFRPKFEAPNGDPGGINDCDGRGGEDLVIELPVGTVVRDQESGEILADLVEAEKEILFLEGGKGGMGNLFFKSSTRQAPDFAQPGLPGKILKVKLELRLMADVGLVGYPNAGKSTLISRLSNSKPKIADYPFTTLTPNLGVVRSQAGDFVLADIPGIIDGASEGRGLGLQFLKHCSRTRLLVLVLDLDPHTERDLQDEYHSLRKELESFSEDLSKKPYLVVLNKVDAFKERLADKKIQDFVSSLEEPSLVISAVSGEGLEDLKNKISHILSEIPLEPRNFVKEVQVKGDPSLFSEET